MAKKKKAKRKTRAAKGKQLPATLKDCKVVTSKYKYDAASDAPKAKTPIKPTAKGKALLAGDKPEDITIQGVPVEFVPAWTEPDSDSKQVIGISQAAATPGTEENRLLGAIVGKPVGPASDAQPKEEAKPTRHWSEDVPEPDPKEWAKAVSDEGKPETENAAADKQAAKWVKGLRPASDTDTQEDKDTHWAAMVDGMTEITTDNPAGDSTMENIVKACAEATLDDFLPPADTQENNSTAAERIDAAISEPVSDDSSLYIGDDSTPQTDEQPSTQSTEEGTGSTPPTDEPANTPASLATGPTVDKDTERDTGNRDAMYGTPPADNAQDTQSTEDSPPAIVVEPFDPAKSYTRAEASAVAKAVYTRINGEGQWCAAASEQQNDIFKEASKTLTRNSARVFMWKTLDRLYPPHSTEEGEGIDVSPLTGPVSEAGKTAATAVLESSGVRGLGDIPDNWTTGDKPELPDNASLAVELAWVQAQRLRVVEDRGNSTVIHLDQATAPAPSMGALGWLETSCRSYAKYIEVLAKVSAGASTDDSEQVRRERVDIGRIRELLEQVIEAKEEAGE